MLAIHEQIHQALKKSTRVLVTCKQDPHIDSLAACLSLAQFLKKSGVVADVVTPVKHQTHDRCAFLPGAKDIQHGFGAGKNDLVIHVGHPGAKVGKFRYDVVDHALNIYISASEGRFEPSDVRAEAGRPNYDLIVLCDTPDLVSLGSFYEENADFFLHTPIINIDHNPGNEQFGHINHVDITHVSTTEALFHFFEAVKDEHIDEDLATTLLAGMIAKTQSFRTPNVTPRSLIVASELVQRGGRRDEVIQHLYRQHELPTLRLWGRVLARLQHDKEKQFVWTIVSKEDFQKSGANEEQLPGLIDELIATTPQAKFVALIYDLPSGGVGGWLKTEPHTNAVALTQAWEGKGSKTMARFSAPTMSGQEFVEALKAKVPSIPVA